MHAQSGKIFTLLYVYMWFDFSTHRTLPLHTMVIEYSSLLSTVFNNKDTDPRMKLVGRQREGREREREREKEEKVCLDAV